MPSRSKLSPHKSSAELSDGLRTWVISLGLPGIVIGIGGSLVLAGGRYFWPGFWIALCGVGLFLFDLWILVKSISRRNKWVGTAIVGAIGILYCWVAWWPAPLVVSISTDIRYYPEGLAVDGFVWHSNYYAFRARLTNGSEWPFTDLKILIATNLLMEKFGSNLMDKCSYKPYWPGFEGMAIGGTIPGLNRYSDDISEPAQQLGGNIFEVECDKLRGREAIEMLAAVVPVAPPREMPPLNPRWVLIDATFLASGRPEKLIFRKCLSANCSGMPSDIGQISAQIFMTEPIEFKGGDNRQ